MKRFEELRKKMEKGKKAMVKITESYVTELARVSLAKTPRAQYMDTGQDSGRGWLFLPVTSVGWERRRCGSS